MKDKLLTIGQLAKQAGVAPSAIRYYEAEDLLAPQERTEAGYRMYTADALQQLAFIKRAQHLGFSLQDIRQLLDFQRDRHHSSPALLQLVEQRYLEIEHQVTNLLIHRHEMNLFMRSLYFMDENIKEVFLSEIPNHICNDPLQYPAFEVLDWLIGVTHCQISFAEANSLLEPLRGMHFHLWREEDTYFILVVSEEKRVYDALTKLAEFEADCTAHNSAESLPPGVTVEEEGFLIQAKGKNAFIYARLFLALEQREFDQVQRKL